MKALLPINRIWAKFLKINSEHFDQMYGQLENKMQFYLMAYKQRERNWTVVAGWIMESRLKNS